MKLLLPPIAFAALALTACQDKPASPAGAQAAAPLDPVVASAVNDIRTVATDPVTGKPKDGRTAFTSAGMTSAPLAPSTTLGSVAPGAPATVLDLQPAGTVPGADAGQ